MKLLKLGILLAIVVLVCNPVNATTDRCEPFDKWVGGERFAYAVDKFGNWNFPDDAVVNTQMTFSKSGIWKYYSIQTDTSFVIVFLDFEATGGEDARAGSHHICVYKLAGSGMGLDDAPAGTGSGNGKA